MLAKNAADAQTGLSSTSGQDPLHNQLIGPAMAAGNVFDTSVGEWKPTAFGYSAEVLNLTRDVVIEGRPGGRSHIFIRSCVPQTIRHAVVRHMEPLRRRRPCATDGSALPQ